jgi:hypothetical protein
MDNTKSCQYCGEAIKTIAIKCKHCGSMLNEISVDKLPTEKIKTDNLPIVGIVAIFLSIAGLLMSQIAGAILVILAFIASIMAINKGEKKIGWISLIFSFLLMSVIFSNSMNINEILNALKRDEVQQYSSGYSVNDFGSGILILIFISFVIYFLPSIIAFSRSHRNRWIILLINTIFGATIIGWLITFIWSLNKIDDPIKGGKKYDQQTNDPIV